MVLVRRRENEGDVRKSERERVRNIRNTKWQRKEEEMARF